MSQNNKITREQLVEKIKLARNRVRFLGVLAIDFDWTAVREDWLARINDGNFSVEIIREAENFVSNISIITSNKRISGMERSYQYGNLKKVIESPSTMLRKFLIDNKCKHTEPSTDLKQKQLFSLRTCYLQIPIPVINIDDEFYFALTMTNFYHLKEFEKLEKTHPWYSEFENYFHAYFDFNEGAKEYSTEETKKGNQLEVINAYNFNREVMFPLPRDSFPETKLAKLVVWALLFTRDGKLLIHKRGVNAKDNRNRWDKSVGGHVSTDDVDSAKAVAREIAEELYKHEAEGQGDHGKSDFFKTNEDKMIFLGEWNPHNRNSMPFYDVENNREENFYFRMNYPYSKVDHDSVRYLVNGDKVIAHTFIDIFMCITSVKFDISKLENSEYKILELHELNDAYYEGEIEMTQKEIELWEENPEEAKMEHGIEHINSCGGKHYMKFSVTPDLETILRSTQLFDQMNEFSDYIKAHKMYIEGDK